MRDVLGVAHDDDRTLRLGADGNNQGTGAEELRSPAQVTGAEHDHAGPPRQTTDLRGGEPLDEIHDRFDLRVSLPAPGGSLAEGVRGHLVQGDATRCVVDVLRVVLRRYGYHESQP